MQLLNIAITSESSKIACGLEIGPEVPQLE